MPKPPRPSASEVLRHNLLILVGLPSLIGLGRGTGCRFYHSREQLELVRSGLQGNHGLGLRQF